MNETLISKEVLFSKIAELVSIAADTPIEKITPESSFHLLGLDSLDSLAMINDLEEEYNVSIPNTEVLKIKTVGLAVESFEKLLGLQIN